MSNSELVLVTAASGFIAGHIVKQLLESGYNVRGTVRNLKDADTKYSYLYNLVPKSSNNKLELIECDLTSPNNWDKAVLDCAFVIHTANPIPGAETNKKMTADDFIKPAMNGMKYLLNECLKSTKIKRFIYTSSRSAMIDCDKLFDNSNKLIIYGSSQYTDTNKIGGNEYAKSKVLTEQFGWNWLKKNNYPFEMVCINPSMVCGPLLNKRVPGSCTFIYRILNGKIPLLPKTQFLMSDVRDVAMAHINALKAKNANGKRYLIANNHSVWAKDISMILLNDNTLKDYYSNIATTEAPAFFVKIWGLFDMTVKEFVVPRLNKLQLGYNQTSVMDLNIVYRPINQSIIDTAHSLIEHELVTKPKSKSFLQKKSMFIGIGALLSFAYYYFYVQKRFK